MSDPQAENGWLTRDVRSFGAVGDGMTDDTEAIEAACHAQQGSVTFPQGTYKITRTILIDMATTGRIALRGSGATIRHTGAGPAFHFIGHHQGSASPDSVVPEVYAQSVMPQVDGLAIVGEHDEADGICLETTFKATLTNLLIRDCRHGIHIVKRNRNVLINGVHIYHNREVGIYLDNVDLHQINIQGSHISYNGGGGIKVKEGNIRNIQITGNDIEYNYGAGGSDVWFIAGRIGIREGAITGNTIQAVPRPGGANVRIDGFKPLSPLKAGLLSITGNHISSQSINVLISDSRGIVVGNNTMTRGAERNIHVTRSAFVDVNHNILDDNPDYGGDNIGGIYLEECHDCTVQANTLSLPHGGTGERGGSIEAVRSHGINIAECTLAGPKYRGVWLEDVQESRVSGCIVRRTHENDDLIASITETGTSDRNMIVGNLVHAGRDEAIQTAGAHTLVAQNVTTR